MKSFEQYHYDFDGVSAQTYVQICKECGKAHTLSTQIDKNPEYYADVFIKCDCGKSVYFCLPVN